VKRLPPVWSRRSKKKRSLSFFHAAAGTAATSWTATRTRRRGDWAAEGAERLLPQLLAKRVAGVNALNSRPSPAP